MKVIENADYLITEDWLKEVGFKWDRIERQPTKHWTLWLGNAADEPMRMSDSSDLGIEIATKNWKGHEEDGWFCWLRSDVAHRYCRFIHIRTLRTRRDLMEVIFGVTGREFDPDDCFYGSFLSPDRAAYARKELDRLDMRMLRGSYPHNVVEADEHRGRPRQDHQVAADEMLALKEEETLRRRADAANGPSTAPSPRSNDASETGDKPNNFPGGK